MEMLQMLVCEGGCAKREKVSAFVSVVKEMSIYVLHLWGLTQSLND